MKKLKFIIELLEPMLATGLEGDPNAGVSLKYISGSVLRGVIISLSNFNGDLAINNRDLFFNENVCFLNSYPIENSKVGLPTPLSWQIKKDAENGQDFFDFVHQDRDEKQYNNIKSPFFVFESDSKITKVNPKTQFAVHTQREVEKGRSTSDKGAVFRYESVIKGTKFGGMILCETDKLFEDIKSWIDGKTIFLGGSRTAGYGKAKISVTDWLEDSRIIKTKTFQLNEKFSITLLSNALVRDKNGQFQNDLTAESLGLNENDIEPVACKTFKKAELVGGFNRKWGVPLPQMLAIKAGSVFTFNVLNSNGISLNFEKGIGARTIDGFGQVAINLNETQKILSIKESEPVHFQTITIDNQNTKVKKIGNFIVERIIKQKLETKLVACIGDFPISKSPNKSQISRLRIEIKELLRNPNSDKDQATISKFFENLKNTAKDQFNKPNMIENQSLERWVKDVVANTNKIDLDDLTVGGLSVSAAKKTELKRNIHLSLINEVLAKAAKEK